ncbi:putative DnaJ domain, Chaperone J-domain superfamily [Septoria linicola]|nr:putative DnaJ domain, Chaperone J-domain superfamily [Septoria linicola]
MASLLPPDPYEALGVAKDATSAAIKMAHRKLVLKCHPDKVTDPAEKQAASDKFHKIQSAYEILIDDSRRERYDASVRLAELRKEAMARQSEVRPRAAEGRTSSYRPEPPRSTFSSRGERVTPQYEERRPSYAPDYFDAQPRSTARKESEYAERTSSRRTEAKERPRVSTKSSKESDKERRKEKSRPAEREVRRERERKRDPYVEDDSESDAEEHDWKAQRPRQDELPRRSRDSYYDQTPRAQRDSQDSYFDDRSRKMASHTADARDYIMSSRGGTRPRTEERRPSPVRMASSRDRVQYIRGDDGRPAYMRRHPSERPSKESKEDKKKDKESSRKTSSRTPERRSSAEEIDERRPPPLSTSKSSPANIHIPSEKQRATSLQPDSAAMPPPHVRRSETMPYNAASRRAENVPPKSSRATEFTNGEPTPATTPDNQVPPQSKFPYARQYADDTEYSVPEGYRGLQADRARPEYTRTMTGSPPPMKEAVKEPLRDYGPRSRESTYDAMPRVREGARDSPVREAGPRSRDVRESAQPSREESYRDYGAAPHPRMPQRTASARYMERPQPSPLNTRTTSYKYTPTSGGVEPLGGRTAPSRDPSPREGPLYGEVNTTRSPLYRQGDPYARPQRPESIKVQSGYGYGYPTRPNGERPQVSRNNSGGVYHQPQTVRA